MVGSFTQEAALHLCMKDERSSTSTAGRDDRFPARRPRALDPQPSFTRNKSGPLAWRLAWHLARRTAPGPCLTISRCQGTLRRFLQIVPADDLAE